MIKEALKNIKIRCHSKSMKYDPIDFDLDTIEKYLKALEIIKRFIWVEDGKLNCGRYCDVEIELDEEDFEDEEELKLLLEVLKWNT